MIAVFRAPQNVFNKFELDIDNSSYCDENEVAQLHDDKKVEASEVTLADAVVDPRTVVVKAVYTRVAQITVPAAGRPDHIAVRAEAARLDLIK